MRAQARNKSLSDHTVNVDAYSSIASRALSSVSLGGRGDSVMQGAMTGTLTVVGTVGLLTQPVRVRITSSITELTFAMLGK